MCTRLYVYSSLCVPVSMCTHWFWTAVSMCTRLYVYSYDFIQPKRPIYKNRGHYERPLYQKRGHKNCSQICSGGSNYMLCKVLTHTISGIIYYLNSTGGCGGKISNSSKKCWVENVGLKINATLLIALISSFSQVEK
jgi:hypothetical protein